VAAQYNLLIAYRLSGRQQLLDKGLTDAATSDAGSDPKPGGLNTVVIMPLRYIL